MSDRIEAVSAKLKKRLEAARIECEIISDVLEDLNRVEPDTDDILDIDIADAVKYGDDIQEQIDSINKS